MVKTIATKVQRDFSVEIAPKWCRVFREVLPMEIAPSRQAELLTSRKLMTFAAAPVMTFIAEIKSNSSL